MPDLCDFFFTSTHRRVKPDIVSLLAKEVGAAVDKVGIMHALATPSSGEEDELGEDDGASTPNRPYWPMSKLVAMTEQEVREVLAGEYSSSPSAPSALPSSLHSLDIRRKSSWAPLADLVLSDKLVTAAVLALIPPTVQVRIAKKFPGNAEGAPNEMMEAAIEGANRGLTVVRVRDLVVYGRAGEEVLYICAHGFEPVASAPPSRRSRGSPSRNAASPRRSWCAPASAAGARTCSSRGASARACSSSWALRASRTSSRRAGEVYPHYTPIAIIERASMPDQWVVVSTLRDVVRALDSEGEQRRRG
ncbi:hypothetical protein DFH09DRAFT_1425136 [Mycena vulgaris]|nr:hypothetical protein DFH09DRAFT_1425136 [Mycena vulgaris]